MIIEFNNKKLKIFFFKNEKNPRYTYCKIASMNNRMQSFGQSKRHENDANDWTIGKYYAFQYAFKSFMVQYPIFENDDIVKMYQALYLKAKRIFKNIQLVEGHTIDDVTVNELLKSIDIKLPDSFEQSIPSDKIDKTEKIFKQTIYKKINSYFPNLENNVKIELIIEELKNYIGIYITGDDVGKRRKSRYEFSNIFTSKDDFNKAKDHANYIFGPMFTEKLLLDFIDSTLTTEHKFTILSIPDNELSPKMLKRLKMKNIQNY
jgi:hypothetical protein